MKRTGIILLALCSLFLSSCGGNMKDTRMTSFKLLSVSLQGADGMTLVVEVGIDNPGMGFEVTGLNALMKLDGTSALVLTSDQLIVEGRTEKVYVIPMRGRIAEGFNPFRLLHLLMDDRHIEDRLSADISARVALRGGLGKKIEVKEVPLSSVISF